MVPYCIFPTFVANSDEVAVQFGPHYPFKDLIYCLFKDQMQIST